MGIATDWAALGILRRHLGLWKALALGLRVQRAVGRGAPFGPLPPPQTPKEAASRAQIAPALVLYRDLCAEVGADAARTITAEVVEKGAHLFLRESIGPLDRATLRGMTEAARHEFVGARLARFPNSTVRLDAVTADTVQFTVTHCHFVDLCRAVDLADLAPIFCAGDASYFRDVEPGVTLTREQTLASGGSCCPFHIHHSDPHG